MDLSYRTKNFFIKTAKKLQEIKEQEKQEKQKKLETLEKIDTDLFFLTEKTKKQLKEKTINEEEAENIIRRTQNLTRIITKIKKEITNP